MSHGNCFLFFPLEWYATKDMENMYRIFSFYQTSVARLWKQILLFCANLQTPSIIINSVCSHSELNSLISWAKRSILDQLLSSDNKHNKPITRRIGRQIHVCSLCVTLISVPNRFLWTKWNRCPRCRQWNSRC